MTYQQELTPIRPTSDRYPGLTFHKGDPSLKKTDPLFKDRIESDDSKFDIFDCPEPLVADANIKLLSVKPFDEFSKFAASFDIETVGADGGECKFDGTDVIIAIGIKYQGKHYVACNPLKTEEQLLRWFYDQLAKLDIKVLYGQNIYGFDLGVIKDRGEKYGIKCPWKRKAEPWNTYRWSNAVVMGRSLELPAWECSKYELIDTYPQVVLYDGLVRKLDSYSLKNAVIGFGLRKDRRIEIGADVYKYWADGDIATIVEYLKFDLDDAELLWDFLIPQRYFMKSYMDWDLTRITTTGTGSWWNQFLCKKTGLKPDRGATCHYQGALTYYHGGLYKNCVKLDFAGLYPSIMLSWLICSEKDTEKVSLKILAFLLDYRLKLKALALDGDKDADGQQMTAKVLANSLYGLWNTRGLNFNDSYAGAAITAYGRNLARYMIKFCVERGVETVGCDTDGIYIHKDKDSFTTDAEREDFFTRLTEELNDNLPGCTKVDFEDVIPLLYVPESEKKGAAEILADKIDFIETVSPDTLSPGLSKNYLMFTLDRKHRKKTGETTYKLTKKGKFKKRDKSWLESGLIIEWFTKYFNDGETVANRYLLEIRNEISSGNFDLAKLQKTVLVASTWKEFPKHGFPVGTKPTIHYVWRGEVTGKRVIKKVFVPSADLTEPYSVDYYLARFDELTSTIPNYCVQSQTELALA